jgi:hypothetical protein
MKEDIFPISLAGSVRFTPPQSDFVGIIIRGLNLLQILFKFRNYKICTSNREMIIVAI